MERHDWHERLAFVDRPMRRAERYLPRLWAAIWAGLRAQLRQRCKGQPSLSALGVGIHLEKPEPETQDFKWQDSTQEHVYDYRTGFELDTDLVRQGRRVKMEFMGNFTV